MMLAPIATVRAHTSYAYDVYLRNGCFYDVVYKLKALERVRDVLVVTDENVHRLYAGELVRKIGRSGFRVLTFVFEPKRKKKSLETAKEIFRLLFKNHADRHTLVLNVGGGTVGDLGGLVAALYLRGIRYIHMPTTLLSQADSGVGGKVNVNFGPHLNSLSVFHHPAAVWIDPDVLKTLSAREYLSGLAEIVKYALVLDPELFAMLEENRERLATRQKDILEKIIRRCLKRKCKIVSRDPKEEGAFRFFNYGHELGHAVEVAYDYEQLLHGEAVSIGMMAASWMGVQAHLTDAALFDRQRTLLAGLGLPTAIPGRLRKGMTPARLAQRIKRILENDKKRTPEGSLWIVPVRLGKAMCTTDIQPDLVKRCLRRLAAGDISP